MPHGKLNNGIYRALLPVMAPSPRGHMMHDLSGLPLTDLQGYVRLLLRHHVLGASLLLRDGDRQAAVFTSLTGDAPKASSEKTLFRAASLTKMVTALCILRLREAGKLDTDAPAAAFLPDAEGLLPGVTIRHLLSHTSGLRDLPAQDRALMRGDTFHAALRENGCTAAKPGETFAYCNFGFGLLGCVIETVTGQPVSDAVREQVLQPLGMRGTLDGSTLDEKDIMPINRVLTRRRQPDVRVTELGRRPLTAPDPARHFGHTAGALYTDAASLSRLLAMLAGRGVLDGERFLPEAAVADMTREHAVYGQESPTLSYGLGLLIIRDRRLSEHRLLGHQGFAYGCADGAFLEEDTGRRVVFLNGGCSEARSGRLGVANRDVLRWAMRKEMPAWK